jgi:hypothetical protein
MSEAIRMANTLLETKEKLSSTAPRKQVFRKGDE